MPTVWRVTVLLSVTLLGCNATGPPLPPDAPGTVPGSETRALAAKLGRDGTSVSFVKVLPAPALPGLPVRGARYLVEGSRLDVVEYTYREQAEAAARLIDRHGSRVGSTYILWDGLGTPHFYQQGRLVAFYYGTNARMLERLERALGPPVAAGS
jgi:hypothetical protein